jgi:hypothetical protein
MFEKTGTFTVVGAMIHIPIIHNFLQRQFITKLRHDETTTPTLELYTQNSHLLNDVYRNSAARAMGRAAKMTERVRKGGGEEDHNRSSQKG